MKKIVLGAVVIVGALSCAGAWYTGQVLPGVLETSVKQANEELAKSLPTMGMSAQVELASLERHFFSSTARYRVQVDIPDETGKSSPQDLYFTDQIDHGPFPLSRLKALKLMPVMATSSFELENSPELAKWFTATQGVAPLSGHLALSYSRAVSGEVLMEKVQTTLDDKTQIDFSGLSLQFDSSADADKVVSSGQMAKFKVSAPLQSGETLHVDVQGLSFSSDLLRSSADFYIGKNDATVDLLSLTLNEQPPLLVKALLYNDQSSETGTMLAQRASYQTGMISYQGQDIGTSEMVLSVKNIDSQVAKSLMDLYSELFSQAQAGKQTELPELTAEQETRLQAELAKLLEGKPGFALEKLAFKTANGDSNLSLSVGLAKPESMQLEAPELTKQLIGQLDFKFALSKKLITDVVGVQAALAGLTDPQAIAQQAKMSSEMAGVIAMSSGLASADDESISSTVHYADGQVNLNGKQMPLEQFMALIMGAGAGLTGAQP